jgi:hypothetical protein
MLVPATIKYDPDEVSAHVEGTDTFPASGISNGARFPSACQMDTHDSAVHNSYTPRIGCQIRASLRMTHASLMGQNGNHVQEFAQGLYTKQVTFAAAAVGNSSRHSRQPSIELISKVCTEKRTTEKSNHMTICCCTRAFDGVSCMYFPFMASTRGTVLAWELQVLDSVILPATSFLYCSPLRRHVCRARGWQQLQQLSWWLYLRHPLQASF